MARPKVTNKLGYNQVSAKLLEFEPPPFGSRICIKCELIKFDSEFPLHSRTKRIRNVCHTCIKARRLELYDRPGEREKLREKGRKNYAANREREVERSRAKRGTWGRKATEIRYAGKVDSHRTGGFPTNFSKDDLIGLWDRQNGQCAICKKEITYLGKSTHVDHDHLKESDNIRGFLCVKCNLGLGMFRDNISLLKNSVRYLEDWARINGAVY